MSVGIDKSRSRDGRDRLLAGAGRLLAERGYAAMELRDVAERGNAPRGSIYHHFPRGKAQLAAEAAALDGVRTREALEKSLAKHGVKGTLRLFADFFRRQSARHPELIGCPVGPATLPTSSPKPKPRPNRKNRVSKKPEKMMGRLL